MGPSLPSFQPDEADSGSSRGCNCCGCEPADRGSVGDGDADLDRLVKPIPVEDDASPLSGASDQRGIPFVVQAGRELFMLANDGPHSLNPVGTAFEASQWVLAELRFDTTTCTFVEASRVRYDWPREAFGSLLAKVAVGDEIDHELINRVTADFSRWLGSQFIGARTP